MTFVTNEKEISPGTMVVFAINPPKNYCDAGIWRWRVGLLLGKSDVLGRYKIYHEGDLYECSGEWIDRADTVDPCIFQLATKGSRGNSQKSV
jgi:hypothetical protein